MLEEASQSITNVLGKDEGLIDLAATALLVAEYLTHPFDKQSYLNRLDKMAATVRPQIAATKSDQGIIKTLNYFLFSQIKLAGNDRDYYNPNNSFLNQVMDSRKGIPISLSVIYMEMGQRLGLPVWGIGLPGHFIAGFGAEASPTFIDVFNQGHILTEDDCLRISRVPFTQRETFKKQFLKPVSKKQILYRMLLNLKYIYLDQQNWADALKTLKLIMILRPNEVTNLRDRGLIYYRLNRLQDAIGDLQRYLFLVPESTETQTLKEHLEIMETTLTRLN